MANVIEGTYTIKEVLRLTKKYFGNRYDNMKRDKIRGNVSITKRKVLNPDRIGEPIIKYVIQTQSTPQYKPYIKKGRTRQHRIRHHYDTVFEIDELSLNTKNWKMRVGSGKIWKDKVSQGLIRSISKETRKKWSDKKIKAHKNKRNLYENVGDWNSRVLGINADFLFRNAWVYREKGHLYGRIYGSKEIEGRDIPVIKIPPSITNPQKIMFFNKHALAIIKFLMNAGILEDN